MQIFDFLYKVFNDIWTLLFNTYTPFGVSIGIVIFGCTIAYVLWQFVLLALGINSSDFSSLGSSGNYYRNNNSERQKERAETKHKEA